MILYSKFFNKGLAPKEALVFPNNYTIRQMNLTERLKKLLGAKVVVVYQDRIGRIGILNEVGEDYVVVGEAVIPFINTTYIQPAPPEQTFTQWLKSLFGG